MSGTQISSGSLNPTVSRRERGNEIEYGQVTELAGSRASRDQLQRMCNRYYFAAQFCRGKDVLEVACGTGQGLGYLGGVARSVVGVDIDDRMVSAARAYYGDRVEVRKGNAEALHFPDQSFDALVHYEAIYYLPSPERFAAEAKRVLRPGGVLIICTANKDLRDFNPSPFTHRYFGPPEFGELLQPLGFSVEFLGDAAVNMKDTKAHLLRQMKRLAVHFHLIPQTMKGKEFLKRMVFGPLIELPAEVKEGMCPYLPPVPIAGDRPDLVHRVLFAVARLPS